MVSNPQAFAHAWIDAWNRHDLDAIMAFYADELDYHSPKILERGINAEGRLTRKQEVFDYFKNALAAIPNLKFEYKHLYIGINSVTLQYVTYTGKLGAEVFRFNKDGLIDMVMAHYEA